MQPGSVTSGTEGASSCTNLPSGRGTGRGELQATVCGVGRAADDSRVGVRMRANAEAAAQLTHWIKSISQFPWKAEMVVLIKEFLRGMKGRVSGLAGPRQPAA